CGGSGHRAGAHREGVEPTPTVDDVTAGAVAEQGDAARDVPAGPVRRAAHGRGAVERVDAAPAVEHVAAATGRQGEAAGDVPAPPVGPAEQGGGAVEGVDAAPAVEHVAAATGRQGEA